MAKKKRKVPRRRNSVRTFSTPAKARKFAAGKRKRGYVVKTTRAAGLHIVEFDKRKGNPKRKPKKVKKYRRPATVGTRKAKYGRWYKGPKGTRVRVSRKHGRIVVDVKK